MRTTQLRQLDLNLLVVFAVMAEERSVSRASVRLLLSQPAVSRALQRLRGMFRDDLLVRTPGGYELTPLGQRVQRELETVLTRLDRLLGGAKFHPDQQAANFVHRGRLGSPLNHASTFLWPTSATKAWLTQRGRTAGPCRWRP